MFYRFRRKLQTFIPKLNKELIYEYRYHNVTQVESKINIEVGLLSEENISDIHNVKYFDLSKIRERLERGDECYLAYHNGKAISYHWVQYSGTHLLQQSGQYYQLLESEACIYHVRVKKEFYRNRVASHIYTKIIERCLINEISRIWIYTNYHNTANRKSLESIGFSKSELIYSIKFGSRYYKLASKSYD